MKPQPILHFWFEELTDKQHFAKDAALDETIRIRFGATLEAAARCELFAWHATPEGRLAEAVVLDGLLVFTRDYLFPSPSMAAVDMQGRSANGWVDWKAANGQTLDELKRQAVGVAG